jgi:hypothetical protein
MGKPDRRGAAEIFVQRAWAVHPISDILITLTGCGPIPMDEAMTMNLGSGALKAAVRYRRRIEATGAINIYVLPAI